MNRITYILPADYAVCAKPAGFLLPKIKKGVTTHDKGENCRRPSRNVMPSWTTTVRSRSGLKACRSSGAGSQHIHIQHIHIKYDGLGFIPLNELLKQGTA